MDIKVTIEKLVFGGAGMGLVDGKVYFVEGALPGEKVLARIFIRKKNYGKAKLLKVLDVSPFRIVPPCPYVDQCGGCQYQHIPYEEELRWKEAQIRESFERALRLDPALIEPIQHGKKDYGYRTSITLHKTSRKTDAPQRLGFIARDNRTPILVDHCLLADENLRPIFTSSYPMKKHEKGRTFKLSENNEIFSSDGEKTYGVRIGHERLWTSSLGFFQNNLEVTALIAQKVSGWVRESAPSRFLDLYAGVGTFSLLAAKEVPEIYCFEENHYGLACLEKNFAAMNRPLSGIFQGRVEQTFPDFSSSNPKEITLLFMDPPRQGIHRSLAEFLSDGKSAETLIYLACDPQILLRDLKIILSGQRFSIKRVVPFDMFPRTKHIETAVWLAQRQ